MELSERNPITTSIHSFPGLTFYNKIKCEINVCKLFNFYLQDEGVQLDNWLYVIYWFLSITDFIDENILHF